MRLEEAIKTAGFKCEQQKALLNTMYSAYWIKDNVSTLLKTHGITIEQFNVLRTLANRHPKQVCVKDIAACMIKKSSNVPRIIDRLVEKDLATRTTSQTDKRETLVALTPKGLSTHDASTMDVDKTREQTFGIDEEEAKLLNFLLEKMRALPELLPAESKPVPELSEISYSEK